MLHCNNALASIRFRAAPCKPAPPGRRQPATSYSRLLRHGSAGIRQALVSTRPGNPRRLEILVQPVLQAAMCRELVVPARPLAQPPPPPSLRIEVVHPHEHSSAAFSATFRRLHADLPNVHLKVMARHDQVAMNTAPEIFVRLARIFRRPDVAPARSLPLRSRSSRLRRRAPGGDVDAPMPTFTVAVERRAAAAIAVIRVRCSERACTFILRGTLRSVSAHARPRTTTSRPLAGRVGIGQLLYLRCDLLARKWPIR